MDKSRYRAFLTIFFFIAGVCFSTWASRIPTVKASFHLNDAELGTLLLAMPISSLIGLPISGYLVSKFDSRVPLTIAFLGHALALTLIGFATSMVVLVASVALFSFSTRILNISMNTQAITIQKMFNRKINGSFHALWSTGGIVGITFSTVLLKFNVPMHIHFSIVAAITAITTLIFSNYLLKGDRSEKGNKIIIGKPDPFVLYLGVIVFFSAVCEGGMFDWSGIYFKEVVGEDIFTAGYLIFMTFMALSRFVSDRIVENIGMPRTYILSSGLIVTGVLLAIIFPYFWSALIGFSLVGFGTASVIPMTFTLAGTSKKYSPGLAISIVTTYVIVGMLLGPPLIGYIAHAFGLQKAFIAFAIAGLMITPMSRIFFAHKRKVEAAN
ncbi:MFS transporter [Desertivirga brevis]|uniref:MFS transporter n=1 Tax=Desertivirga brevis TaxID=2810310 RepID=UPI001A97CB03|nr:MFS transporter [Pedobacter sp. SYSU D00873]